MEKRRVRRAEGRFRHAIFAANLVIEHINAMKFRIALILIMVAALTRLLPHPPNFTPLGAIGLFGAAYLQRRWLAWIVPFAALFLTDLLINNVIYSAYFTSFAWITSWYIYAAIGLVVLLGYGILRNRVSPQRVVMASLGASVVFFLVSNFSTWAQTTLYPKTAGGLLSCYAAGLPFFGNTLIGDLLFSAVLFGGYAWVLKSKLIAVQN